ncbi:hypothetical protein ELQ35_00215 [Peribacillus cavernae]|uniref:DinB family protein n=1 Tax=Peribacillus cavernae TaxID=1674310 RepID=A0A433HW68_9BACI|nr:hypothetical protein [Peribacillus cavernae]MDQ0217904.1 hypothetical protein [Peribacillus cavernae]RUQ32563.1 hypothetical protein ELQ35_00215 [Peribacillus cavernae]
MQQKDLFLQQLSACYDQNSWFVSLSGATDGLLPEQASLKGSGTSNSIWEIVNHLLFYNHLSKKIFNNKVALLYRLDYYQIR